LSTRLTIGTLPRRLEARLDEPPGAVRAAVVLCHPHPAYGGDMDNGVVVAVAEALRADDVAVLRFNFGGVGRSEGVASGGDVEVGDVRVAIAALAARLPDVPRALVGYSFGAWAALRAVLAAPDVRGVVAIGPPLAFLDWTFLGDVPPPVDVVVGTRDQFCPADRLARVVAASGGRIVVHAVPEADHFFAGDEVRVAALVVDALRPLAAALTPSGA